MAKYVAPKTWQLGSFGEADDDDEGDVPPPPASCSANPPINICLMTNS